MALDRFQPYLFVSAGEQSNKYLTPVISPDGIAAFQAQRAQDLSGLTVRFGPIQAGSGDPSPTNIRPISGRTGMTVAHGSANLLDGISWTSGVITADGVISTSTTGEFQYSGLIPVVSGETYKFVYYNYVSTNSRIHGYDASGTWVEQINVFTGAGHHEDIITIPSGVTQIRISTGKSYRTNIGLLSIASETTTIPITWASSAGTVYGGTLDVVSGVLTVTHAAVQIKDKTWTYDATYTRFSSSFVANGIAIAPTRTQKILCDTFAPVTTDSGIANVPNNSIYNGGTNRILYIKTDTVSTSANFVSTYGDYYIVFPLATPQTYQLTPTQVQTIAGFNQIYSDAGPIIDIKF